MQAFGGYDAQFDTGDHAQRAQRDLRRLKNVGMLFRRAFQQFARGRDQRDTHNLRGQRAETMPVPCVPVLMAPAMLCTSISPRFSCASPCANNVSPSSLELCAAQHRRRSVFAYRRSMPCISSSESNTSSLCASGVNECPAPTTRTCRPSRAKTPMQLRQFVDTARHDHLARLCLSPSQTSSPVSPLHYSHI